MAKRGSLQDAFVDELRDVYHAERQILKALPKMIKKARAAELRQALTSHLEVTKGQVDRLEAVFATVGEKVQGKRCEGMAGIIDESKAVMKNDLDEQALDACLVAAAQRVEHYEMAAYRTLITWARALGHVEAEALLATTLAEERAADAGLSALPGTGLKAQTAESNGEGEGLTRASSKHKKKPRA